MKCSSKCSTRFAVFWLFIHTILYNNSRSKDKSSTFPPSEIVLNIQKEAAHIYLLKAASLSSLNNSISIRDDWINNCVLVRVVYEMACHQWQTNIIIGKLYESLDSIDPLRAQSPRKTPPFVYHLQIYRKTQECYIRSFSQRFWAKARLVKIHQSASVVQLVL